MASNAVMARTTQTSPVVADAISHRGPNFARSARYVCAGIACATTGAVMGHPFGERSETAKNGLFYAACRFTLGIATGRALHPPRRWAAIPPLPHHFSRLTPQRLQMKGNGYLV